MSSATGPAVSQAVPASTQAAPSQPQTQSTAAGAQLAVTYQLPVQPVQQPTQLVMAQPAAQQPVQVQVGPPAQQAAMLVQVPQVQPQPVAMSQPVQPVPYYQPSLPSGSVAYTAQPQPGVPQVVMNPGYSVHQPNFIYTPGSYFVFTIVMATLCGIFSPATLCCSIPAVFMSLKSKTSNTRGNIKQAKQEGLVALGLIIVAIAFALIVATVFTGIFVPLGRSIQFGSYSRRRCYDSYYGRYYNC